MKYVYVLVYWNDRNQTHPGIITFTNKEEAIEAAKEVREFAVHATVRRDEFGGNGKITAKNEIIYDDGIFNEFPTM